MPRLNFIPERDGYHFLNHTRDYIAGFSLRDNHLSDTAGASHDGPVQPRWRARAQAVA
jgi:hypothetical protein